MGAGFSSGGSTLPATVKPVLTGLVDIFNLWLREGLTGQPVVVLDVHARDVIQDMGEMGVYQLFAVGTGSPVSAASSAADTRAEPQWRAAALIVTTA